MNGWLTALGPEGTALALLLLGHVLGDFVFQTDELAKNKHRPGPLLSHSVIVLAVHGITFIPLLTRQTALIVGLIGVFHLLIDAVSARLRHRKPASAGLFLGDQLAHLLVILVGWSLMDPSAWTAAPVVNALGGVDRLPWSEITAGALYVSAFVFAHEGGNAIVRGVLPEDGPETEEEDDLEAGSLIGSLERWIILLLGLAGRWESVALVVAAKSIARFEELKKRAFAEYFLVGTLASVLVAIVLAVLVSVLV
ncbi:DUF3307 domain-containing protein [Haloarchaeobius sp. HRN-SO-5]|uniref:DUF3307 domain-containing protein n=1 Tax=Haloarchaeobius sp. HRN-SO-5 TaxID=3446118 RepID=UPI003EBEAA77